jgi:hypothetical protein
MTDKKSTLNDSRFRIGAIVVLLALALFGVYRYSTAADASAQPVTSTNVNGAAASSTGTGASGGAGCACGGGSGAATTPIEGAATPTAGVQKISVNVSGGGYSPNVIKLQAGVPAEITFSQSSGCTGVVQSQQLGFQADLTGGPQTVKLAGLQPGTYGFACGMNMVTGQIVVQ